VNLVADRNFQKELPKKWKLFFLSTNKYLFLMMSFKLENDYSIAPSKNNEFYIYTFAILFLLFLFYNYFSNTCIGFGDTLGFVWYSDQKFDWDTSANSHFGYVALLRLFVIALPMVKVFHIASMVSIISALITLYLVAYIVFQLTQKVIISLIAMLSLGFSFTFWRQTEIVEVYTLNMIFVSLFILYG
jgi:hypothetical protein